MHRSLILALLVLHAIAQPVFAQTITWVGGGSAGAWTDPANWNPARLPDATDDVAIPAGTPFITIGSGTHSIRSITAARQIRVPGGTLAIAQAASLTGFVVNGGTLTLNGPTTSAATNQITAGLLTGAGDITCSFNTSWTGGEIAGTGSLTLAAGTVTLTGPMDSSYELVLRRNLIINSTCNFTLGTLTLRDGADLTLGPTATLNFGTDPFIGNIIRAIDIGSFFTCNGRINQTSTANSSTPISINTQTGPTAVISVTGGSLGLVLSGDQYGSFQVAAGKSLGLSGNPTATFQPGSSVSGAGRTALSAVEFTPGTFLTTGGFTAQGGTVILRDPVVDQSVSVTSGTLEIHGAHRYNYYSNGFASSSIVRIMDSLNFTGSVALGGGTFTGPGMLTFEASSVTTHESNFFVNYACNTQNYGTIEPRVSGFAIHNTAVFINRPGGIIRLQSGNISSISTPGTLINEGLITANFPGIHSISGLVNTPTGIVEAVGQGSLSLVIPADPPQRGRISAFADITISGPVAPVDVTLGEGFQLSAGNRLTLTRGFFTFAPGFAPTANELFISACTFYLDADFTSIPIITIGGNGIVHARGNAAVPSLRMTGTNPTATVTGPADLTITSTAQLDGALNGAGRLILAPTCVAATSSTGTRNWSRPIENQGTLNLVGGTITLSNTALHNTGIIHFDTASNRTITLSGSAPALLLNTGTLTSANATGTGAANITCRTDQRGIARAPGTNLNFTGPVSQVSGETLTGGRWITSGNGILRLPNGVLTRVIGQDASVVLGGASNSLPWLSGALHEVAGELELQGFRTLTLTPGVPTGFSNLGRLILGTDASLSVLGAFRQSAAAELVVDYDEPPIDDRLRAFNFQLDGSARADFTNGFMIDPSTPLRLFGGGAIAGRFSFTTAPQSRRVVYAASSAEWRFVCVADTDDGSGLGSPDGGVTIDDLLYYLTIYTQGLIAADTDDGSGLGTSDGGVTIDDLLYYLVRYESGC